MGDERAETYLRLRAEAELRRAAAELRRLDAAAEDLWADPGMSPFQKAEMAEHGVGGFPGDDVVLDAVPELQPVGGSGIVEGFAPDLGQKVPLKLRFI